ncbi:hypothetical protein YC2023_053111 [Brassica napus]
MIRQCLTTVCKATQHQLCVKPYLMLSRLLENNCYSTKDFMIKTNVGRTRTTNNIFKLKFTISTIVKHIVSISSLLYFYYPLRFADIINMRLAFKTSVYYLLLYRSTHTHRYIYTHILFNHNMFVIQGERRIECQAVGDVDVEFERQRVRAQQSAEP